MAATASGMAGSSTAEGGELSSLVAAEVSRQVGSVRAELERALEELRQRTPEDRAALVVFSGDLDRVMAAFVIATGAAASGLETSIAACMRDTPSSSMRRWLEGSLPTLMMSCASRSVRTTSPP